MLPSRDAARRLASALQDPNPLWGNDDLSLELTGALVVPTTMVSVWFRSQPSSRGNDSTLPVLATHFELKAAFGYPSALVVSQDLRSYGMIRAGEPLRSAERLLSVSEPKSTRAGLGRFWRIETEFRNNRDHVVATETATCFAYDPQPGAREVVVAEGSGASVRSAGSGSGSAGSGGSGAGAGSAGSAGSVSVEGFELAIDRGLVTEGALASRVFTPVHHDPLAAQAEGVADIFLDTSTQQALFARMVGQFGGPRARLERLCLKMGEPIVAGDLVAVAGDAFPVTHPDGWANAGRCFDLKMTASVNGQIRSSAQATVVVL